MSTSPAASPTSPSSPPQGIRERISDSNIWLIYGAIFVLGLAYGISLALVGLFLNKQGYSKADIGSLAIWFASGVVALSLPMGSLIKRFSARTMLIASLAGYAISVSLFPLAPNFAAIAAIRALDGACSVGIWVSCETILLSRSNKENKAFVTSLYAMSMALGYILGPFVARGIVAFAPMKMAFFVAGATALGSVLLVLFRLEADVAEPEHDEGSAPGTALSRGGESILWRIKTSCFATFVYGYFQAAVVLFLPLYLVQQKGILEEQTILIPAFFAAGMLLFTNVFARIGDARGHLALMRWLAVVGTFMILGFVFLNSFAGMCVAVFVAGASLASISPLSLALQGATVRPHEYGRANSVYNVFYAAGMLLGPKISSKIFESKGGIPMLYHMAALWAAFVIFAILFRNDDPKAARPTQSA